jgi:hypothetical protein
MIARQPAQNVPFLRDTSGPDLSGLLASFPPAFLRDPGLAQNADKTQTKCRQNRKCDFISRSAPTTYNFNAVKCLNFPDHYSFAPPLELERHSDRQSDSRTSCGFVRSSPLPGGEEGEGQTGAFSRLLLATKFAYTVQNGTKRDDLGPLPKPTAAYQRLTTTRPALVPFCRRPPCL